MGGGGWGAVSKNGKSQTTQTVVGLNNYVVFAHRDFFCTGYCFPARFQ